MKCECTFQGCPYCNGSPCREEASVTVCSMGQEYRFCADCAQNAIAEAAYILKPEPLPRITTFTLKRCIDCHGGLIFKEMAAVERWIEVGYIVSEEEGKRREEIATPEIARALELLSVAPLLAEAIYTVLERATK